MERRMCGSIKDQINKVPKTMAPAAWANAVARYNDILVDGKQRRFPEQMLLGAESVLARLIHERSVSKQRQPLGLGEVVSRRSFTATGEINPLSKRAKSNKLTIEGNVLKSEPHEEWEPRSVLAIMDGIETVRWSYIFTETGEEEDVRRLADALLVR